MMQPETFSSDVIVVGAGLSGLSCARELTAAGFSVRILEARDRVGGRTYTKRSPEYGWLDCGASYVGPTQRHILRLARDLGVDTYKVYEEGDYIFYFKKKALRYPEGWPHWNPLVWMDCNHVFRELDKMAEQVPIDAPWEANRADTWDRMTFQNWIDQVCWTSAAKAWLTQFCHSNMTSEAWEVSLLFVLWYLHSAGGVYSIWEISGAAQEMKFVGGTQQISEKLAERLKDGVTLDSPVVAIEQNEDSVTVTTKAGLQYKGRYIVVAVPPALASRIHYHPPLPADKAQLLQRMPMGACIKTETYYKTPFWREIGLNGEVSTVDMSMIVGSTLDDTKPDGSFPAITGFIMGDRARHASSLSKEERKQQTLLCYQKCFGTDKALEAVGYEEYHWMEEPYTGGCYSCVTSPGVLTSLGSCLRRPVGRLYFAGSETAVRWSGYMDGAVEAGHRAAADILEVCGLNHTDEKTDDSVAMDTDDQVEDDRTLLVKYAPSVGRFIQGASVFSTLLVGSFIVWRYSRRLNIAVKTTGFVFKFIFS